MDNDVRKGEQQIEKFRAPCKERMVINRKTNIQK